MIFKFTYVFINPMGDKSQESFRSFATLVTGKRLDFTCPSTELRWVDSFDFVNEVEVRIGGDDLIYSVTDHGSSMKGISRLNFRIGLQKLNGE